MDRTANARRLRRDQTLAEKVVWNLVRNRRREDYDGRRTEALELFRYVVLRFRNERVLVDPGGTADDVLAALRSARL